MVQLFSRIRAALLVAGCVTALVGCAGSVAPEVKRLPERVELSGTFYRGEAYQSGPQVLASLLSQQGIVITPGLLEKPLRLPGAEDKLQQNLQNLAREYGMVVYPLDSNLPALLTQVAAGYPVMVRFSEGSAFWAEPRYAILSGYDRLKQKVLLRAGMNRRELMSFSSFESALEKSGGWAVLIQKRRRFRRRSINSAGSRLPTHWRKPGRSGKRRRRGRRWRRIEVPFVACRAPWRRMRF